MANARTKAKPLTLKPKDPRPMPEIEQDHANVCARLGMLEYQISVLQEDAKSLKENLRNINYEAAARKESDAKTEPKKVKEESNG